MVSGEFFHKIANIVHVARGHIGSKQMILELRQCVYTRSLDMLCKNICKSCDICIRNKSRRILTYGYLSQLGPASEPYQIMSLDTIGGFSGNGSSKKYLHLLVDHFSRFAYFSTSKTQKTLDFVQLIDKVLKQHKIGTLLTDQYSAMTSELFKHYLSSKGVELVFTATDCAFSNGLNERLNQTLINRIRCRKNSGSKKKFGHLSPKNA